MQKVRFYTYPEFLFFAVLALVSVVLYPFAHYNWADASVLSWVWIGTLLFVALAIGTDMNWIHVLFLAIFVAVVWFTVYFTTEVNLFLWLFTKLTGAHPKYDPGEKLIIAACIAMALVPVIVVARLRSKWEITNYQIQHTSAGEADVTITLPKNIKAVYRNLLKALLIPGTGNIEVWDLNNKDRLLIIEDVYFLWFRWKRIDKIIQQREVELGGSRPAK